MNPLAWLPLGGGCLDMVHALHTDLTCRRT